MVLKRIPNIFPHSRAVDTGLGKERVGQATIVVSLDGTGDADDIQEGINLLPSTGGEVFIKEGTYKPADHIEIKVDNTTLSGTGAGTIIQIGAAETTISISCDKAFCIFQNFKVDGVKNIGKEGIAFGNGSNNCLVTGCVFINQANAVAVFVRDDDCRIIGNDIGGSLGIEINSGNRNAIIANTGLTQAMTIDNSSDYNIVMSNFFNEIIITSDGCDKNIIVANIHDTVISNDGVNTELGHNVEI